MSGSTCLVGPPGIGKSFLARELFRDLRAGDHAGSRRDGDLCLALSHWLDPRGGVQRDLRALAGIAALLEGALDDALPLLEQGAAGAQLPMACLCEGYLASLELSDGLVEQARTRAKRVRGR